MFTCVYIQMHCEQTNFNLRSGQEYWKMYPANSFNDCRFNSHVDFTETQVKIYTFVLISDRFWYSKLIFRQLFFCWYLRPLTRDLLVLLARQDPESFMTPGLLFNRVTSSQTNSKRFWIIPKHAKTFQIYTKSYQITPGIKKECFGMFLQGRLTSEID